MRQSIWSIVSDPRSALSPILSEEGETEHEVELSASHLMSAPCSLAIAIARLKVTLRAVDSDQSNPCSFRARDILSAGILFRVYVMYFCSIYDFRLGVFLRFNKLTEKWRFHKGKGKDAVKSGR